MYCRKCGKEIISGNVCKICGFDNVQKKYVKVSPNVKGLQQYNMSENANITNSSSATNNKITNDAGSDAKKTTKKTTKKSHLGLIIGSIIFIIVALIGVGTFGYMYFFGSIKDKRDGNQLLEYIEERKFDDAVDYYDKQLSKSSKKDVLNKFISNVSVEYDEILEDYNNEKCDSIGMATFCNMMNNIFEKVQYYDEEFEFFVDDYEYLYNSKTNFKSGIEYMESGDYENAINKLMLVSSDDTNYSMVNDKMKEAITKLSENSDDYSNVYSILDRTKNNLSDEDYNSIKKSIDNSVIASAAEKAESYLKDNKFKEAKSFLEELVKNYPDLSELKVKLSSIEFDYVNYAKSQAKKNFDAKDYGKAVSILSVAISQLGKDNVELNNLIKEYKSYMDTYVDEMDYLNMNGGIHTGIEIDNTGVSHEHSIDLYGGFICYLLNGKYNTFTGKMALNSDSRSTNGNYWYEIYGDESLLYTSQKFTAGVLPIDFSIDVSNINVLKIVVKADSFDGWVSSNNIFLYDAILKSNK